MKYVFVILLLFVGSSSFASSYILYDIDGKNNIQSYNAENVQSIASLTKLVTAMVCIDSGKCDNHLLTMMLIRSDNMASEKIASGYKEGRNRFIFDMNRKVKKMGLVNTKFIDPTGLSVFNVSNVYEYTRVLLEIEKYPLIEKITSQSRVKDKNNWLHSTNTYLIDKYKNIRVSKTGYTRMAGWCLAMIVENNKKRYAIVILGENNPNDRIKTAIRLIANISRESLNDKRTIRKNVS